MLNILIPIKDRTEKFNDLLSSLNGVEEINVLVGVTKSQRELLYDFDSENISIFEFEENSKREEILNALSSNLQNGEIMVIRKPISFNEFKKFCSCNEDIVFCKENKSKTKAFFYKIWQQVLKLCLGVKLYEGDTSVIKFNEDVSAVLTQTHDLSYATRVDRWKGLNCGGVETKEERCKPELDRKAIISCSITALVALIIALVTTICVCINATISIIGGLLLVCLDAICFATICIMIVVICFNCRVGKKYNKKANLCE